MLFICTFFLMSIFFHLWKLHLRIVLILLSRCRMKRKLPLTNLTARHIFSPSYILYRRKLSFDLCYLWTASRCNYIRGFLVWGRRFNWSIHIALIAYVRLVRLIRIEFLKWRFNLVFHQFNIIINCFPLKIDFI